MISHSLRVFVALLPIAACAGTPMEHSYSLVPTAALPVGASTGAHVGADVRVDIPTYLAPSGMVIAEGPHELHYAAHHRWSEPLQEATERALRQALIRSELSSAVQAIEVVVHQFHGDLDGQVVLNAVWTLTPQSSDIEGASSAQFSGHFSGTESQDESSFDALAAAHFRLITRLAKTILSRAAQ